VIEREQQGRALSQSRINVFISVLGIYFLAGILLILGSFVSSRFFSTANMLNVAAGVTILGIVSMGAAFITYSGHFADLSIPTTMAFSGIMAVEMLQFGIVPAIATGLLVGVVIGMINGFVIGKFRANPIVWTLAMAFVVRGLMRWIWSNRQIYPGVRSGTAEAGEQFVNLYRYHLFGLIPVTVIVLAILAAILHVVIKRSSFGRQLQTTGSNIEVARMSAINVPRNVGLAFVICAFTASIAGIFLSSLSRVGAYYMGEGYDFAAVTAVVIGGVTLAGGRGSIVGVIGGVLVIGLMRNIMTLMGVDTFAQTIVTGAVFILAVGIQAYSLRRLGRDDA
jgi:ribose/xylose/arabinose/galactoside ABC-type transport system permease subunit